MMTTIAVKVISFAYPTSIFGTLGSAAFLLAAASAEEISSDEITVALPIFITSLGVAIACTWKARGLVASKDAEIRSLSNKIEKMDKHLFRIDQNEKKGGR